ncbi:MAG: PilZ domain-containing protein [Fimbriimonadaceae bacterium]|nr:PilZ domain-containing protein [Fimbriimonadaceae bacterium]
MSSPKGDLERVSLVWYEGGEPQVAIAQVQSKTPFAVTCPDDRLAELQPGCHLLVITQSENMLRFDGQLSYVRRYGTKWYLEFESADWHVSDQRRYPRFERELQFDLRAAVDNTEGVEFIEAKGFTVNISVGGALLKTDATYDAGQLLRCHFDLGQFGACHVLAIVAHRDPAKGYGLEFVDFVGSGRYNLAQYLSKAA